MPPDAPDAFVAWIHGPFGYAFAAILGALLGSFANVVILRVPQKQSIVRPGSHCFACNAPVAWYDNLPIISYLILRGRCRSCGVRFSPRYLFVEAATALLIMAVFHLCIAVAYPQDELMHRVARFGVYTLFVLILVIITFIDLDHKLILDRITYPSIPVFFGLGALLRDRPILELAIGVAVGYGAVRLISDVYYWLTKREGLGYGDGKLLAIVGGLLGWRAVVFCLFGGSFIGTVITVPILLVRRRAGGPRTAPPDGGRSEAEPPSEESLRHVELPFGPFLAAAAVAYLFVGDAVMSMFVIPGR